MSRAESGLLGSDLPLDAQCIIVRFEPSVRMDREVLRFEAHIFPRASRKLLDSSSRLGHLHLGSGAQRSVLPYK